VTVIEISCVEVWREVSNYIDGVVEPALRQRMEEHFKGCEHCAAVVDGTRNVVRLVGDGRVFELPAGFDERLKVTLARKLGS
jgi:anti-sigma factor RsiW